MSGERSSFDSEFRIAGAPISWGVSEVPGWGYQMSADRVLGQMRQVGLQATEVGPEGLRVLEAAGRKHNINFSWSHFDWSCQTYLKTGGMMPEDGLRQLRDFDAIFLGAIVSLAYTDSVGGPMLSAGAVFI